MTTIKAIIDAYEFTELLAPGKIDVQEESCETFTNELQRKQRLGMTRFANQLGNGKKRGADYRFPIHLGLFDGEVLQNAVRTRLLQRNQQAVIQQNPEDANDYYAVLTLYCDPHTGAIQAADKVDTFEPKELSVFLSQYFGGKLDIEHLKDIKKDIAQKLQSDWSVISESPLPSEDWESELFSRLMKFALKSLAALVPLSELAGPGLEFGERFALGKLVKIDEIQPARSFFDRDLQSISQCLTTNDRKDRAAIARLTQFLTGQTGHSRIDLEQYDPSVFRRWLSPTCFPMGRWPAPSQYALSLMQQVAVNVALHGKDGQAPDSIRTVNGPPGTGKTTLLKDIFADMTVQQAHCMVQQFERKGPAAAVTSARTAGFSHPLWKLDDTIAEFGIIVASANNAAVENISKELPQVPLPPFTPEPKEGQSRADWESARADDEVQQALLKVDSYRHAYADNYAVSDDDVWGVYSAAGGKSANMTRVLNTFKDIGELEPQRNWQHACTDFVKQYGKVQALMQSIGDLFSGQSPDQAAHAAQLMREGGTEVLDDAFWQLKNEELQQAKLWFDTKFRREQAQLFVDAVAVRKAFIEEIKASHTSFFVDVIDTYKQSWKLTPEQAAENLACIQLVIPVISTTFASAQSFLKKLQGDSIPNLFIDEAGQALPVQALGLVWRARHIMAVGDPFQIPPVQTLAESLRILSAVAFGVDYQLFDDQASVQRLGDAASHFGAYVGDEWIGMPLWVHRRCLNPMFTISNKISYHDKMVLGVSGKPGFGAWLDVLGPATKKQFVPNQLKALERAINARLEVASPRITLSQIYVISPFKVVASELKRAKFEGVSDTEMKAWRNQNVGTVHTFQGKEAAAVFFVLGADANTTGSIGWAMQSANLLNVAVTRAKKEFYIIGDKTLFGDVKYLQVARKELAANRAEDKFAPLQEWVDNLTMTVSAKSPEPTTRDPKGDAKVSVAPRVLEFELTSAKKWQKFNHKRVYVTWQTPSGSVSGRDVYFDEDTHQWHGLPAQLTPERAGQLLKKFQQ